MCVTRHMLEAPPPLPGSREYISMLAEKAKAAKANIASSSFVELEPYDAVVTRPARSRSVEVPQV